MKQHLSEDEMAQWLSGERLAETERHLRECSQCAAEVDATEKMFALFRESGRQWGAHWFEMRPAPAPSSPLRFGGAIAACAVLCVVLGAVLLRPVPAPAAEAPFLEMPYVAPLAPYERVEIVRMDVPVAELTAEGLDVRVPDTGASVLADVVLGQDGRAHAIRLVSNPEGSITQ
jgi:anti-sigma factor RsiW